MKNFIEITDVTVSDKVQSARVITFHTVENGLITKQTEFWPSAIFLNASKAAISAKPI